MKELIVQIVGVALIIGAMLVAVAGFVAILVYMPWAFNYGAMQYRNAEAWYCENQNGQMEWATYPSGNWYQRCAPKQSL